MAIWSSRSPYNVALAALISILLFAYLIIHEDVLRQYYDDSGSSKSLHWPGGSKTLGDIYNDTNTNAFVTFLANWPDKHNDSDLHEDKYFVAVRILVYQLLHAPETKTTHGFPFIVLVNEHVSETKRKRLTQDGAITWEPEPVDGKWIHNPEVPTWEYVMTKLRVWELTQYDRICFMDADTILHSSLDDVFIDSAADLQTNANPNWTEPATYVLAGLPDIKNPHHWPPEESDYYNGAYMNAGFFVTKPSLEVLDYYLHFIETPGAFGPDMPEQNLLNFAHDPRGNMPWKRLDYTWNVHGGAMEDLKGSEPVKSMHTHWWADQEGEMMEIFLSLKWRMEGFWEGR